MQPATYNIEFVRGDSYSLFGRVRTKVWDGVSSYVPGPYRDLTGYTGLAQVRNTHESVSVLFSFDVVIGNQITSEGSFFIEAQPADTVNLSTTLEGVWDLQFTTPNGEVFTYVKGTVSIIQDVSRV